MQSLAKHLDFTTLTILILLGNGAIQGKVDSLAIQPANSSYFEARKLRHQYPDSSRRLLESLYTQALEEADTADAIQILMGLAEAHGHLAEYKDSYDKLWTALLLADASHQDLTMSSIYKKIARHYSFYSRKSQALTYLDRSLRIRKDMIREGRLDSARLAENYLAYCSTFRELGEPELSRVYLDSSFSVHDESQSQIHRSYLLFEQAVLHNSAQEPERALDVFQHILPWFSKYQPGYQVLLYYYMGNSHRLLDHFAESEQCYKRALYMSEQYNSHFDFTPLVYEKLSDLHLATGDLERAYQSLKTVKDLDRQFFDSRSKNNRPLLEIQDEFRKTKEEQNQILQEQKIAQLEQADQILLLQRTMLIGSLVFLCIIGFIYLNQVKSRHRAEKRLIQKQQELEMEKTQEIVELKNKELATSTLKLIEKDTFIDSLKDRFSEGKGDIKRHEIMQLIQHASNHGTENWKEFEARFVAVNKSFYQRLTQQYPKLTQGDLRVCALVKLNFSSKEMAKLLGMSVESVHTTRSRLRKKLNLSREVNLAEFIASI